MNLTIALDEETLRKARALARQRGTSLQELLRQQLRSLVGEESGPSVAAELLSLMETHGGHSGGRRIDRNEAYEGRT